MNDTVLTSTRASARWKWNKALPLTLKKIMSEAKVKGVKRIDTRPNGWCGWYALMLFSWLTGADLDTSGAVMRHLRRVAVNQYNVTIKKKYQHHLMDASEAGLFVDAMGCNLLIWSKVERQWQPHVYAYRLKPDRPWLMLYHNTYHMEHWEVLYRPVGHGSMANRAANLLFTSTEVKALLRVVNPDQNLYPVNVKVNLQVFIDELEHDFKEMALEPETTSEDEDTSEDEEEASSRKKLRGSKLKKYMKDKRKSRRGNRLEILLNLR